jgi:spore maturation protein CgeB/chromosome segregation ATPase
MLKVNKPQPSTESDSSDLQDRVTEAYAGLIKTLESAFYQTQQGLNSDDDGARKGADRFRRYRGASELVTSLKQRVLHEQLARQAAEQALEQTQTLLEETQGFLQEERIALQQHLAQWSQHEQASIVAAQKADSERLRLELDLATATQKYKDASEQLAALRQRLLQEEATRRTAEQVLRDGGTQADRIRTQSQEEKLALQQRLEGELESVRARLAEANQKYRGVTEQVAIFKQRVTEVEATRQTAEQQVRHGAAQIEQAKSRLQDLQQQIEKANEKYRSASEQVTTLQQRLDESNTKYRSATEHNAALQQRFDEANQKYRAATEQISTLKQRVAEQDAARQQRASLQQQVCDLNDKHRVAKDQLTELRQQLDDANLKYQGVTAQLTALQQRLEEANHKCRSTSEQVAALKRHAQQEREARHAAEQTLEATKGMVGQIRAQLERENSGLQQHVAQLMAEAQAKKTVVESAENNASKLSAELELTRSRLELANEKYRIVTGQVAEIKDRAKEEQAARRVAQQALHESAIRNQQLQDGIQNERTKVRQALDESNTKYRSATEHNAALQQRFDEANQKYRAATEQISTLKQRVAEQDAARQQRASLQQQVCDLNDKHRVAKDQLTELRQQLDDANLKYQGVTAQLTALQQRLEEANHKCRSTSEQVAALKRHAQQEREARHAAEQTLEATKGMVGQIRAQLERENSGLQQHVAQLMAEAQAKKTVVESAENNASKLSAELELTRSRLELANEKYRIVTGQVAEIKDRAKEEQAARRVAQQALHESAIRNQQLQDGIQNERTKVRQALDELENMRGRLLQANDKYRNVTAQVNDLKHRLEQEHLGRLAAEKSARETGDQLHNTNLKYRHVTGKQVPELQNKLKTFGDIRQQLERIRQQKITVEQQLAKTRATISFRFGYLLTHSTKSMDGVLRLPSELWALHQEAKRRRSKKNFAPGSFSVNASSSHVLTPSEAIAHTQVDTLQAFCGSEFRRQIDGAGVTRRLRVACIMDDFTFGSFSPECTLSQLTPSNWRVELEVCKPDLLFIESAWRGKDEQWGGRVSHCSVEVQGIVQWCRAKHIPTAFWNKEDPSHFDTFLSTAKLFDHVFTTDIDCIHRYKASLGHERVYLLPFACQPAAHNPLETYERKDAFCFAGAYYIRYPERTRDLANFVMELPTFRPLEIYDRNFGKNNPNYQFPEEYRQYIVGTLPFEQIDKAYKGYRYAINLNSIKQSQSMFARRVFELLACNTVTISNFSRGLRLLFGDLVITSDSGSEVVRRLSIVADNDQHYRKFRLAGLRKVLQEHTYGQRLGYVVSKVTGHEPADSLPHITVLALANTHDELKAILKSYSMQIYTHSSLHVVLNHDITASKYADERINFVSVEEARSMVIGNLHDEGHFIASMLAADYYGPNYLTDIALATRYTKADLIGKAARYVYDGGAITLQEEQKAYTSVAALPARAAAVRRTRISSENVLEFVRAVGQGRLMEDIGIAIDEFNYCENGSVASEDFVHERVDDLQTLNTGIRVAEILHKAEQIAPERRQHEEKMQLTGRQLADDFRKNPSAAIAQRIEGPKWRIASMLPDGKHEYLYATEDHDLDELGVSNELKLYLDVTPGLNIQLVVVFLDKDKQKIGNTILHANRNEQAPLPSGTVRVRFGLRLYAGGDAEIQSLILGHRNLQPAEMITKARNLVLTNHYPSYSHLYRNAFVHTRVRAYHNIGTTCDVFRMRSNETVSYHEFEDVDAISGSQELLHQMLSGGRYKNVLVHFLDQAMWEVLQQHIHRIRVVVWMHGAEFQPWFRRQFDYQNDEQRAAAKARSDQRLAFWRDLLHERPTNLKIVFVSRSFSEEVMEDLGFRIPAEGYTIIHNPIDTKVFTFVEKPLEQRKKVLCISSFSSRKYGNDINVKAIQLLAQRACFGDMEFRLIGDGALFEATVEPLRNYRNVCIEQRFLRRDEIAALHKEYGIFLCATRWDSHGVSRDEAMSSGLIPVTNAVGAIKEFVDDSCGIVAAAEDPKRMADGIANLYHQPAQFAAISKAAAQRVRGQSEVIRVVKEEIALLSE